MQGASDSKRGRIFLIPFSPRARGERNEFTAGGHSAQESYFSARDDERELQVSSSRAGRRASRESAASIRARRSSSPSPLGRTDTKTTQAAAPSLLREALVAYGCVGLWIFFSGAVITYNKFLLSVAGFPYPITLTLWHMLFCSTIAFALVRSGWVKSIDMEFDTYVSAIVPIGACYAVSLWVGNAAYLHLSVSFIQMLKALMPVAVFLVGSLMGVEKFELARLANMSLIAVGVAIASFGEINFNVFGVALQMGSIVAESIRLTLVQLLLQSRGLKLNPITTLYYVSPCCFVFLLVPFFGLELLKVVNDDDVLVNPFYMITNAAVAFCLNMAVFLLIGKTSALSMNVAGVIKDWALIGISFFVFGDPVSSVNLGGYLVAFLAVCYYNYDKYRSKNREVQEERARQDELVPMLSVVSGSEKD